MIKLNIVSLLYVILIFCSSILYAQVKPEVTINNRKFEAIDGKMTLTVDDFEPEEQENAKEYFEKLRKLVEESLVKKDEFDPNSDEIAKSGKKIEIILVDSNEVNAFTYQKRATSDTLRVYFYRGFLDFIKSDDEFVNVTRHEINHHHALLQNVVDKHKAIQPRGLGKKDFWRRILELEVDVLAVDDVLEGGSFNPYAGTHFHERLIDKYGLVLSHTHGMSTARIQAQKDRIMGAYRGEGRDNQYRTQPKKLRTEVTEIWNSKFENTKNRLNISIEKKFFRPEKKLNEIIDGILDSEKGYYSTDPDDPYARSYSSHDLYEKVFTEQIMELEHYYPEKFVDNETFLKTQEELHKNMSEILNQRIQRYLTKYRQQDAEIISPAKLDIISSMLDPYNKVEPFYKPKYTDEYKIELDKLRDKKRKGRIRDFIEKGDELKRVSGFKYDLYNLLREGEESTSDYYIKNIQEGLEKTWPWTDYYELKGKTKEIYEKIMDGTYKHGDYSISDIMDDEIVEKHFSSSKLLLQNSLDEFKERFTYKLDFTTRNLKDFFKQLGDQNLKKYNFDLHEQIDKEIKKHLVDIEESISGSSLKSGGHYNQYFLDGYQELITNQPYYLSVDTLKRLKAKDPIVINQLKNHGILLNLDKHFGDYRSFLKSKINAGFAEKLIELIDIPSKDKSDLAEELRKMLEYENFEKDKLLDNIEFENFKKSIISRFTKEGENEHVKKIIESFEKLDQKEVLAIVPDLVSVEDKAPILDIIEKLDKQKLSVEGKVKLLEFLDNNKAIIGEAEYKKYKNRAVADIKQSIMSRILKMENPRLMNHEMSRMINLLESGRNGSKNGKIINAQFIDELSSGLMRKWRSHKSLKKEWWVSYFMSHNRINDNFVFAEQERHLKNLEELMDNTFFKNKIKGYFSPAARTDAVSKVVETLADYKKYNMINDNYDLSLIADFF
ncbi:hypothetical protein N9N67_03300 [Bacteriovoracaceae bacterium]|nr:hypothetical protein [Bacteriovoracaceae bacterium]